MSQGGAASAKDFLHLDSNPPPLGARVHWLRGERGLNLRVMTAPAPSMPARGSIVVCPGYTEFIEKYFECARELQERGFAVLIIDWRGQGLSDRELPNRLKAHFRIKDDAPSDLAKILSALRAELPRPRVILAHSMGGAVALRALQLRLIDSDQAVFSAPMWGVKSGQWLRRAARVLEALGFGQMFVPGTRHTWSAEDWRTSAVSSDEGRHARNAALVERDARLALAGPSVAWAANALETVAGFAKPGALSAITIPILVAMAARDTLVDNRTIQEIASALPQARTVEIPDAKHEILQERDEARAAFWAAFDAFIRENGETKNS